MIGIMRAKILVPVAIALANVAAVILFLVPSGGHAMPENFPVLEAAEIGESETGPQTATFANGCFWCTEAVFQRLKGVEKVESGYTGGARPNPTYEQVCTGVSGHAEAIRITYDPAVISFPELLEVFWRSHDPTTLNRQGNDVGTQYRSSVFYHNEYQKRLAEAYKAKIDAAGVFRSPVVTEIVPAVEFHPAEGYHQNYFNSNPRQGYCRAVIQPKVDKLAKVFAERLK
jgi:peptide-methionine (S)-S-oxide reductase